MDRSPGQGLFSALVIMRPKASCRSPQCALLRQQGLGAAVLSSDLYKETEPERYHHVQSLP